MPNWLYLGSEPFQCRYAIVGFLVRDCKNVFEIGGYMTPIGDFLDESRHEIIESMDPLLWKVGKIGKRNHLGCKYPEREFAKVDSKTYAVVVLGLELHLDDNGWEKFYELVKNSKRTVLGVVPDHIHSLNQYNQIVEKTGAKVKLQVTLDLSKNEFDLPKESSPPKTTRKIVVLEP